MLHKYFELRIRNSPSRVDLELNSMPLEDSLELPIAALNVHLEALIVVRTAGISNYISFSLKRFILKEICCVNTRKNNLKE